MLKPRCRRTRINALRLCILFAATVLAFPSFGQQPTAQVTGLITDSSGAAVPGATITITNTEAGTQRQTT